MNTTARSGLFGDLDVDVELDAPIGAQTWFGIGGRADALIRPRNEAALVTLIERCNATQTPVRILGKGANLLVADDGVDGVVIRLDHEDFTRLRFNTDGEVNRVLAMAGADLFKSVQELQRQGLAGFAQMTGIPGSIGGAVRMNAGGSHGCIGDCIQSVTCLDQTGQRLVYDRNQLDFDYRSTNLPDHLILSAVLELEPEDPVRLRNQVKEIFAAKKASQPMADQSAGCVFRNPRIDGERISAGKLIDETGCKGERIGGAQVSMSHANFITTGPDATASHVQALMQHVRDRVEHERGVVLEPEVVIWSRSEQGAS
ncbi:MAG: UDP-N-acetylmuramate dehydrogenase [Phycisphaerales bacterium]|nr:UDP-N-acetylmuramate dehydrogenase [Phycisphaerales bacterium]